MNSSSWTSFPLMTCSPAPARHTKRTQCPVSQRDWSFCVRVTNYYPFRDMTKQIVIRMKTATSKGTSFFSSSGSDEMSLHSHSIFSPFGSVNPLSKQGTTSILPLSVEQKANIYPQKLTINSWLINQEDCACSNGSIPYHLCDSCGERW